MAGGAGVEWYFGYQHPHSDLTCQDYRVREKMWRQCRIALDFFADHEIPFWNMTNANDKIGSKDAYCLCDPGKLYLVYLKHAEPTTLDLSDAKGIFEILWFNPREGRASPAWLNSGGQRGRKGRTRQSAWRSGSRLAGRCPARRSQSRLSAWCQRRRGREDHAAAFGQHGHGRSEGQGQRRRKTWRCVDLPVDEKASGPGEAEFEDAAAQETKVTLHGAGKYVLDLRASDGKQNARGLGDNRRRALPGQGDTRACRRLTTPTSKGPVSSAISTSRSKANAGSH